MAHTHGHSHGGDEKRTLGIQLTGALIGGIFVADYYILKYLVDAGETVASLSALIGALIVGVPIVVRAVTDLWKGELHMTELVAIAILACFAQGNYVSAGIVGFIMLLGDIVEHRTAIGVHESIEALLRITPTKARVVDEGQERMVEASELRAGTLIRIRPGENVPADGLIREGSTALDESTITGESVPVDKGKGDQVFAGTTNLTGVVLVEVTRAGNDTTLGRVKQLIEQAEATRIPLMTVIDRYVKWYTPFVLMVAAIILAATGSIDNAITALIVTCPCALVLATPTAMVAALSAAARLGILVKDVRDLEAAAGMNAVVFDKTGTLTTGTLEVSRLKPFEGVDPEHLLAVAYSAESHSNHPIAKAISSVAEEAGITPTQPSELKETPGKGISAVVDGREVVVGTADFLREKGIEVEEPADTGYSILHVAEDGRWLGWIGLEDRVRPEARKATEELKRMGMKEIVMLTGDREGVAAKVAEDLGCTDFKAKCLPEDKLEVVERMKEEGKKVVVVGDGINDAPALAAGDIGVAMGAAGSDVAVNSATIALMSADLGRLPMLFDLSRKTRRVVVENLLIGGVFIIGGLLLAGMGALIPEAAAIIHVTGSWVVLFNSARLVRFGESVGASP